MLTGYYNKIEDSRKLKLPVIDNRKTMIFSLKNVLFYWSYRK